VHRPSGDVPRQACERATRAARRRTRAPHP
jgi:hypothetical protein